MFLPFFVPPCGVCSSERIFNALTLCMHEEGGAKLFQRSFVVIDAQAHLSRWSIVACVSYLKKKNAVLVGHPLHVRAKERGLVAQTNLCL